MKKTNAMRLLDTQNINYERIAYDPKKGISGTKVADQLGESPEEVFKTLVTHCDREYFVFLLPVTSELDLKKAAQVAGVKKIEMIPQRELLPLTGYVHGGCSPVGMKKLFPTYIHCSGKELQYIYVSGGKIGLQMKISPKDLQEVTHGKFFDIVKGE